MSQRTILLDLQTVASYQRLIVRGVINYWQRHRSGWRFASDLSPPTTTRTMRIENLKGVDGVISHDPEPESAEAVKALGVPVVWVEQDPERKEFAGCPIVNADHVKISRLAFDHLRDKGLRRFAFSSTNAWDGWPMRPRRIAFTEAVRGAGFEMIDSYSVDRPMQYTHPEAREALLKWVGQLPRPIGIFCSSPTEGWRVIEACNQLGIHVPDEVAIIGCDKNDLTSELTHPPLSTIDHGMEAAGYEAAAMLQRLLDGEKAPRQPILIAPAGVIQRQSSDTLAIEDVNVRDAVRFIRENASRAITPPEVVDAVLIGRRRLEIRFKEVVGRTIQEQIVHERVEHARHLLINTDLSLNEIGRRCGYPHLSRLSEAFHRVIGVPPSAYRRNARQITETTAPSFFSRPR